MSNLRTHLIKENGDARSIKVSNPNIYLDLYVTFRSLVNGNLISTTNSRNSNCLLIIANRNGVDRRIQRLRWVCQKVHANASTYVQELV